MQWKPLESSDTWYFHLRLAFWKFETMFSVSFSFRTVVQSFLLWILHNLYPQNCKQNTIKKTTKLSKHWRFSHVVFLTIGLVYASKEHSFISSWLLKLLFSHFLLLLLFHPTADVGSWKKEKTYGREKMKDLHISLMEIWGISVVRG